MTLGLDSDAALDWPEALLFAADDVAMDLDMEGVRTPMMEV